jgi:hypothetical protein
MISFFARFLYPSFCLHCRGEETKSLFLCQYCLQDAALVESWGRCKRCFREQGGARCIYCKRHPPFFTKSAFCFEPTSPLSFLMRDTSRFAKTIAAFLVLQWERLHFPVPNLLVADEEFGEVKKEFKKFLPIKKAETTLVRALYLSREDTFPENFEPFIGTEAFRLSLYGAWEESDNQ